MTLTDVNGERSATTSTLEAFNLAAGFVDADGLHTDDELWALIGAFARPAREPAGPGHARSTSARPGSSPASADWLATPSVLFDILVEGRPPRRHRPMRARTTTGRWPSPSPWPPLDAHTSETELEVDRAFRGHAARGDRRRAPRRPEPRTATERPGRPRRRSRRPRTIRRRDPSTTCSPSSTSWSASRT